MISATLPYFKYILPERNPLMTVRSEIKVRGYHLDMFGHVNNARYLEFLEEGRWAFIDANPQSLSGLKDLTFFVVNININYRSSASLGEVLEIQTRLSKICNTSGVMRQEIYNPKTAKLIVDADVTFVIADAETQKPIKLIELFKGDMAD